MGSTTAQRILETVVVSRNADGSPHIAPLGVRLVGDEMLLAPFHPSRTLENLRRERTVTVNAITDTRIMAGALTGRRDWPVEPAEQISGFRLAAALSHTELDLHKLEDDDLRPHFYGRVLGTYSHGPFPGLNRAQAAVLEASILVSRLHMLDRDKVDREIDYLRIAIDKTAGTEELEAWGWLMEAVDKWRQTHASA
ncbi:DUF447 family protein [Methylonatrum kenyense]|uniref:DUF447 domain-containing protein n=1 Tax=Methylonatrum kenyense TaxID=455253 RepID=UPI0020BF9CFC|nr:DUF447 domain-containing protein [Methylonatrum kenyense]MCK8515437.1 DUF447 family protein [Methylonatrum kenyense]